MNHDVHIINYSILKVVQLTLVYCLQLLLGLVFDGKVRGMCRLVYLVCVRKRT